MHVCETKVERSIELTCRLCLTEHDHYQPIFNDDDDHSVAQWIHELTSLQIESIPETPASLCSECKAILENFESFKNRCLENDKLFQELFLSSEPQQKGVDDLESNPDKLMGQQYPEQLIELVDEPKIEDIECLEVRIIDSVGKDEQEVLGTNPVEIVTEQQEQDLHIDQVEESKVISLTTELASGTTQKDHIDREFPKLLINESLESQTIDGLNRRLCTVCNKYVTRLKQHMLIHEEVRSFQCEFCSKGFNQMSNLKKHVRTHTKEKPYLCSWCDKGFTNSSELKVHIRSHTLEKPFKCGDCDKSFITSGHLVRHARSHSGVKPYACDLCGLKFSTSSHLVRHNRIHAMEYPYSCMLCDERFMRTEYLKSHKCKK